MATTAFAAWSWPVVAANAQFQPWPRKVPTPNLQVPSLDGTVWSLAGEKGKPVLLNFWASWCEPCRSEIPSLELLATRHKTEQLQVIAVNYRETDPAVRRFIDTTALKLPVLCDSDGAAAKAFGVHTFPSTVAINRQGRALFIVVGECDWSSPSATNWVAAML
jgi:thiol-disulfide isomerase/thioredoxin